MKDADYTIFDFDGTIADTLEPGLEVYNRKAPEYNFLPSCVSKVRRIMQEKRI
jgi:phosphoglycolate phosphatase-like HAD superfamily hydrolase